MVQADLKEEIESKVTTLRNALQQNDLAQIQADTSDLNTTLQKLGQAVYSQQGADPQAAGPSAETEEPPESGQGEDTVEGEYREV